MTVGRVAPPRGLVLRTISIYAADPAVCRVHSVRVQLNVCTLSLGCTTHSVMRTEFPIKVKHAANINKLFGTSAFIEQRRPSINTRLWETVRSCSHKIINTQLALTGAKLRSTFFTAMNNGQRSIRGRRSIPHAIYFCRYHRTQSCVAQLFIENKPCTISSSTAPVCCVASCSAIVASFAGRVVTWQRMRRVKTGSGGR